MNDQQIYLAVSGKELRLGEPDCGEGLPSQPKRNPCDPPKGPCQPADPPGYPSKPKPKRKPFCIVQKLKLNQIEAFLKHLLRSSIGILEKYFDLKTEYGLKPIWETEKLELNRWNQMLTRRYPSYLVSLHRVHRREFHITSFCVANSNSGKPSGYKKIDEVCKSTEVKKTKQHGQSCNEKSNAYHQKKVKCDKRQLPKEKKVEAKSKSKTEREIVDPVCNKTCLARGKCEWPHTVPPPKMEYVKVTCPPLKFMKPNSCPSISEHLQNDTKFHVEAKTNFQKKQICAPPPLPKPPFEPIPLCPCPPPRKMHPGPCPGYESKQVHKPILMQPCPLKKKYSCSIDIHYCPLQKKPCNLRQDTNCKQKKNAKLCLCPVIGRIHCSDTYVGNTGGGRVEEEGTEKGKGGWLKLITQATLD
ncbi:hypothetical protein EAG_06189 [Camponotus floridanus]|uniref:Uncharacterized protein n=1 Tax=Camponotus floridanus TaxID=104421 RepID=E2AEQ2_CAMFO|nr:hypothetical protein EAG_06189 [Camponotus floridanus]